MKSSHISIMSLHVCHNVSEKVLDDSFYADHLLHLLSLSDEEKLIFSDINFTFAQSHMDVYSPCLTSVTYATQKQQNEYK